MGGVCDEPKSQYRQQYARAHGQGAPAALPVKPRRRHIDKRYRALYRMSMIENLEYIGKNGVGQFLEKEEEKWKCPECGAAICCHNGICFNCGLSKLKIKTKLYRWEDD